VAGTIIDKLTRRHPHVFGDVPVSGADEVIQNWDTIKAAERAAKRAARAVAGGPAGAAAGDDGENEVRDDGRRRSEAPLPGALLDGRSLGSGGARVV
jgi:XTP/dITP diphosphohydrolase